MSRSWQKSTGNFTRDRIETPNWAVFRREDAHPFLAGTREHGWESGYENTVSYETSFEAEIMDRGQSSIENL